MSGSKKEVAKNQQGQWQKLLERIEIERAYMQENQDWFLQSTSAGIPFTQEPLLGEFGYLLVGKKASQVPKRNVSLAIRDRAGDSGQSWAD